MQFSLGNIFARLIPRKNITNTIAKLLNCNIGRQGNVEVQPITGKLISSGCACRSDHLTVLIERSGIKFFISS